MGKRKDQATMVSALIESIRQSVVSASSSSHPSPMPAGTVPPGAPPLDRAALLQLTLVQRDLHQRLQPHPNLQDALLAALESKLEAQHKRGLCSGNKMEDIIQQTGQKIKMEYCPRVKGPSVREINSLVAHDIGCAIRSLVGMKARTFYDLDQTEKWKVWNAMSPKYEWDENDEPMFNWILKRAHERYTDRKY
ncbi:hypothetical protein ACLB2K_012949 [Fragaria x ananassa]